MITTKMETITPEHAASYLKKMIVNRPLSESKSLEYAVAMDEGKWCLNGETIKFNDGGMLFDGQHRLQACVLAGKPFKTYVIRGIEDKMAFATVDVGRTRTHGDIFGIAGIPNSNQVSGAAMLIYLIKNNMVSALGVKNRRYSANTKSELLQRLKTKQVRATTVTKEDLLKFVEPFRNRLINAVRFGKTMEGRGKRMLTGGQIGGLFFLFSEKSEPDAVRFFTDLAEGVGLSSTDPVYRLRERLISNSMSPNKINRFAVVFLVCKAWSKRRGGEKVTNLKIVEGENFPKIV